jgi:hypothetical protein
MTLSQAMTEAESRRRNRSARPAKPAGNGPIVKVDKAGPWAAGVAAGLGRIRQELNNYEHYKNIQLGQRAEHHHGAPLL